VTESKNTNDFKKGEVNSWKSSSTDVRAVSGSF